MIMALGPANELNTAEQLNIVDRIQQPMILGQAEKSRRQHHRTIHPANPRIAFVETPAALRQLDDRLQKQVDAIVLEAITQDLKNLFVVTVLEVRLRREGRFGHRRGGNRQGRRGRWPFAAAAETNHVFSILALKVAIIAHGIETPGNRVLAASDGRQPCPIADVVSEPIPV